MAVSLSVALICIAYAIGVVRFRHQARGDRSPPRTGMLAMFGGLLVIELALASPLDELADRWLSAHMVQHLLLMLVAAPLLVFARPTPYLIWSLPLPQRRWAAYLWNQAGVSRLMRFVGKPAVCWAAFCAVVLLWHVPAIYRWAMGGEIRHALMHFCFLGSGLLFWTVVLDTGRARSLNHASRALYVFSAALVTGLPGALITFARQPLYILAPGPPNPGALSVLADQQLAGLIMWIPMDLILFGVALALFAAALGPRRVEGPFIHQAREG